MKVKVTYVTDAYCCWCYGFAANMSKLVAAYEERISIRVLNGGMIIGKRPIGHVFGGFPDPVGLHMHISRLSGQVFGESYLEHIRDLENSPRQMDSMIPAQAMAVFRAEQPGNEYAQAAAIQHAYYAEGLDLLSNQTYEIISTRLGIDPAIVLARLHTQETRRLVADEFNTVRKLGVGGYPAVLVEQKDGRLKSLANGFMPYAELARGLDLILERETTGEQLSAGQSCGLDGRGCA